MIEFTFIIPIWLAVLAGIAFGLQAIGTILGFVMKMKLKRLEKKHE